MPLAKTSTRSRLLTTLPRCRRRCQPSRGEDLGSGSRERRESLVTAPLGWRTATVHQSAPQNSGMVTERACMRQFHLCTKRYARTRQASLVACGTQLELFQLVPERNSRVVCGTIRTSLSRIETQAGRAARGAVCLATGPVVRPQPSRHIRMRCGRSGSGRWESGSGPASASGGSMARRNGNVTPRASSQITGQSPSKSPSKSPAKSASRSSAKSSDCTGFTEGRPLNCTQPHPGRSAAALGASARQLQDLLNRA